MAGTGRMRKTATTSMVIHVPVIPTAMIAVTASIAAVISAVTIIITIARASQVDPSRASRQQNGNMRQAQPISGFHPER
jgi:hypothetical protein